MKQLILGGARSGKSALAERRAIALAAEQNLQLVYIATSTAEDNEMTERIVEHQARRSEAWQLVEEPIELANVLTRYSDSNCLVVDCLTLWLSNCMQEKCWKEQSEAFFKRLEMSSTHILMVSNEVGWGIVPLGQLSREFVDHSGRLHQKLAGLCDQVTMSIAGLPHELK